MKPVEKQIKDETTKREAFRKKVQIIFNNLTKPATDLKRAYESFGTNKPILSLNPIYCLFLNTYIYYSQVLPVEGYSLTLPPSDFSTYFDFLNTTISQRKNLKKEINDQMSSNNDRPIEEESTDNNFEETNDDTNNDTEIPDNEIYL